MLSSLHFKIHIQPSNTLQHTFLINNFSWIQYVHILSDLFETVSVLNQAANSGLKTKRSINQNKVYIYKLINNLIGAVVLKMLIHPQQIQYKYICVHGYTHYWIPCYLKYENIPSNSKNSTNKKNLKTQIKIR